MPMRNQVRSFVDEDTHARFVKILRPEQVNPQMLLGLSISLKPGPGQTGRSAARSLLRHALATVGRVTPHVGLLDLRDHPIPLFDGRTPGECGSPAVEVISESVRTAGALLLSVPAYWGGVAGVFKNLIDVLCGPAYELVEGEPTVFAGKPVGLIVVGADEGSAPAGASQASGIIAAVGARLMAPPVVVSNPRKADSSSSSLSADLVALSAELAAAAGR